MRDAARETETVGCCHGHVAALDVHEHARKLGPALVGGGSERHLPDHLFQ